jgi:chromosome segregation ATPase
MDSKPGKKGKSGNHPGVSGNGMAEIKELITQMESFIKEGDALASMQIRRVEAMKETLKTVANRLGGQLKEKDETIRSMESKRKEMEETLSAQIHDLEKQISERPAPIADHAPIETAPKDDAAEIEVDRAELIGERPEAPKERSGTTLRELEGRLLGGPGGLKDLIQDIKRRETEPRSKGETPAPEGLVKPEKQVKRAFGQDQNKLRLSSLLGPIKKQS